MLMLVFCSDIVLKLDEVLFLGCVSEQYMGFINIGFIINDEREFY